MSILAHVRGKRRLRVSVPNSPATLGAVGLFLFDHACSAGTSMLPWMVCRCFLGWSASSHELESAWRHGAAQRRCVAGSETPESCRLLPHASGVANGRQRRLFVPPVTCVNAALPKAMHVTLFLSATHLTPNAPNARQRSEHRQRCSRSPPFRTPATFLTPQCC